VTCHGDASSLLSTVMPDELVVAIPNLAIPQNLFVLSNPKLIHLHEDARKQLLEGVKTDGECHIDHRVC
jgi:hypothetical protein